MTDNTTSGKDIDVPTIDNEEWFNEVIDECFECDNNCGFDGVKAKRMVHKYISTHYYTEEKLIEKCLHEVTGFAGTNHNNKKFCDHYEERYKYLTDRLNELKKKG